MELIERKARVLLGATTLPPLAEDNDEGFGEVNNDEDWIEKIAGMVSPGHT